MSLFAQNFMNCRSSILCYCYKFYSRPMSSSTKIGIIQLCCKNEKSKNFETASSLIKKAKDSGAKVVFLPECFDYVGESQAQSLEMSESLDGDTIMKYKLLAKDLKVWLSLGGFHEKAEGVNKVYNAHVLLDDNGEIRSVYHKTHLFNLDIPGKIRLKETDFTVPGEAIRSPVETPIGQLGLSICYDMRFPELATALRKQGAEILTYPSAFTVPTGKAHWEVLLRNRAIENQCFVIAAAQVGQHNQKRASYGHSLVVDPWGEVLVDMKEEIGFKVVELDKSKLGKVRAEMPVITHKRPDLYGYVSPVDKGILDDPPKIQFGQHILDSSVLFHKTRLSMAFVNLRPFLPGHVLISPLRVVKKFAELDPEEVSDMFMLAQRVTKALEHKFGGKSFTIAIQDGVDAGQSVFHVHLHIIPRKEGDLKNNDDIYGKLQEHDAELTRREPRSSEVMAKEASELRDVMELIAKSNSTNI